MKSFSLASLVAAATLFTSTFAGPLRERAPVPVNAGKLAVYYGQGPYQKNLAQFCQDSTVDIIPIGFMTALPGNSAPAGSSPETGSVDGYPALNFGNQCGNYWYDSSGHRTGMFSGCDQLAQDIATCQSAGKKILLSIGGGASTLSLQNAQAGTDFANFLWGAFGPVVSGYNGPRPFNNVVVDGFDFDIETPQSTQNVQGIVAAVNQLRQLMPVTNMITAAPQCVVPDAIYQNVLSQASFDAVFVQFYNTAQCSAASSFDSSFGNGISFDDWANWLTQNSQNKAIKLYMGLPASTQAVYNSKYYITPNQANTLIQKYRQKYPTQWGGVMLWEMTYSDNNQIFGQSYAANIKACMEGSCLTAVSTTTSSSTTSSSTTTRSSTSPSITTTSGSTTTTTITTSESTTTTSESTTTTASESTTTTTSTSAITTSTTTTFTLTTSESTTATSESTTATSESTTTSGLITTTSASTTSTSESTTTTNESTTSITVSTSTSASTSTFSSTTISSSVTTSSTATTASGTGPTTSSIASSTTSSNSIAGTVTGTTSSNANPTSSTLTTTSTASVVPTSSTSYTASPTWTYTSTASTSLWTQWANPGSGAGWETWTSTASASSWTVWTTTKSSDPWESWTSSAQPSSSWTAWTMTTKADPWASWTTTSTQVDPWSPIPTTAPADPWQIIPGTPQAITVTVITTSYTDICPTGYTIIPYTTTITIPVTTQVGNQWTWPTQTNGCPSGFFTTTSYCAVGCGSGPQTVTLTLPTPAGIVTQTVAPVPVNPNSVSSWIAIPNPSTPIAGASSNTVWSFASNVPATPVAATSSSTPSAWNSWTNSTSPVQQFKGAANSNTHISSFTLGFAAFVGLIMAL